MKITAIKPAVKTKGRFNIFVDEKYSFSLDELQLVESGLKRDQEINDQELELFKNESTFGKAYTRALDYIMRRPRSEKELRDYAWRKKWSDDLRDRVISKLLNKGYLDDMRFAKTWVRHRALGKPMSKRRLTLELKQKGLSDEVIDSAFAESEEFDEIGALRLLIEKKRPKYSDNNKLIAYLAGQGFSYGQIKTAMQPPEEP